jgi:nicotinate-nucleotide--dimethylbenzimidazole phosphoribosyltransferase
MRFAAVPALDDRAAAEADARQARLTKPRGALGRLERLGTQLAAIAGTCPPPVPHPAAVAVFAADHGVVAQGVTPWPQEVTAQMVVNLAAGGAAINVLARQVGATVTVVDVGVATALPDGIAVERRRIRDGTADLSSGPAMSIGECERALGVGAAVAADLVAAGAKALVTGEMGIGNTTAAAAVIAALLGRAPADVTGRGTGVDDDGLARKVAVVEAGVARCTNDPLQVLAEVGGLEIAALAGFIVAGATAGVPVVVDGVIADAALLAAERLAPGVAARCIAGHRSTEPGAAAVLDALGLEPVLDLGLRLGEGSGACLALPVLEAAALVLREMATFDDAGVTDKDG